MSSPSNLTGRWIGHYREMGQEHPITAELVETGKRLSGSMRDGHPNSEHSVFEAALGAGLPPGADEQIEAQLRYALQHGWAISVEYTDDIHPRNSYWEMWGLPVFDTKVEDAENIMREVRAAREAFPEHYIKVIAYDPTYTRQTTALSFIVNRPSVEKPFRLDRIQGPGRVNSYRLVQVDESSASANGRATFNGKPAAEADST